jgi:hypothetical protein
MSQQLDWIMDRRKGQPCTTRTSEWHRASFSACKRGKSDPQAPPKTAQSVACQRSQPGKTPLGLEYLSGPALLSVIVHLRWEASSSATISSARLAPQCAMFGSHRPACPCILPGRQKYSAAHALLASTLASPSAAWARGLLAGITACTERNLVCRPVALVPTTQAARKRGSCQLYPWSPSPF